MVEEGSKMKSASAIMLYEIEVCKGDTWGYHIHVWEDSLACAGSWDPKFGYSTPEEAMEAAKNRLNSLYGESGWNHI